MKAIRPPRTVPEPTASPFDEDWPLPGLTTDLFLFTFAAWTVACNAVALLRLGFHYLAYLGPVAVSAAALWCLPIRKRDRHPRHMGSLPYQAGPKESQGVRLSFLLLTAAVVLITLVAHRPDRDDASYVNQAVTVLDDPDLPPYYQDGKVNILGALQVLPLRRIQSFEMLGAAVAVALRLEPLTVFHILFPALAAVLLCLAHRELLRLLAPRRWVFVLTALLVFLLFNGQTHRSYGNFSLVRLHQGKTIMLSCMLPLVIACGLRWGRSPGTVNWTRLALSQICALGMSVNALWLAPFVSLVAILCEATRARFRYAARTAALGAAASIYVLVLGFGLRFSGGIPAWILSSSQIDSPGYFAHQVSLVLGGVFGALSVGVAAGAWLLCPPGTSRRLCLWFPAATGLLLANPLTAGLVAKNLTGVETYWRVLWALPVPVMAGLAAVWPFHRKLPPAARYAAFGLTLACLVAAGWGGNTLRPENGVRIGAPGLKTGPGYEVAVILRDFVVGRPNVIAPESISAWLTTIRGHPYPLLARYFDDRHYGEEGSRRREIKNYISGSRRPKNGPPLLREAIQHYGIAAVSLPVDNPWKDEITSALHDAGLAQRRVVAGQEIWSDPVSGNEPRCPRERH